MFAEDSYIFSSVRNFDGWAPGTMKTACEEKAPKKEEEEGRGNITARLTHPRTIPPSLTHHTSGDFRLLNTILHKIHLINYATAL